MTKLSYGELAAKCADQAEQIDQLRAAVTDYLAEFDNPARDYRMRHRYRSLLREIVGAPSPEAPV